MITNSNITFIAGVHGVGKSYFGRELCSKLSLDHLVASKLIRAYTKKQPNKKVKDIGANQNRLLQALRSSTSSHKFYLLDGHFCLLNSQGVIKAIPPKVFKELGLNAIVVLKDFPTNIKKRLKKRDEVDYTERFLGLFQSKEIQQAKVVSKKLKLPLLIHDVKEDYGKLLKFVQTNTHR